MLQPGYLEPSSKHKGVSKNKRLRKIKENQQSAQTYKNSLTQCAFSYMCNKNSVVWPDLKVDQYLHQPINKKELYMARGEKLQSKFFVKGVSNVQAEKFSEASEKVIFLKEQFRIKYLLQKIANSVESRIQIDSAPMMSVSGQDRIIEEVPKATIQEQKVPLMINNPLEQKRVFISQTQQVQLPQTNFISEENKENTNSQEHQQIDVYSSLITLEQPQPLIHIKQEIMGSQPYQINQIQKQMNPNKSRQDEQQEEEFIHSIPQTIEKKQDKSFIPIQPLNPFSSLLKMTIPSEIIQGSVLFIQQSSLSNPLKNLLSNKILQDNSKSIEQQHPLTSPKKVADIQQESESYDFEIDNVMPNSKITMRKRQLRPRKILRPQINKVSQKIKQKLSTKKLTSEANTEFLEKEQAQSNTQKNLVKEESKQSSSFRSKVQQQFKIAQQEAKIKNAAKNFEVFIKKRLLRNKTLKQSSMDQSQSNLDCIPKVQGQQTSTRQDQAGNNEVKTIGNCQLQHFQQNMKISQAFDSCLNEQIPLQKKFKILLPKYEQLSSPSIPTVHNQKNMQVQNKQKHDEVQINKQFLQQQQKVLIKKARPIQKTTKGKYIKKGTKRGRKPKKVENQTQQLKMNQVMSKIQLENPIERSGYINQTHKENANNLEKPFECTDSTQKFVIQAPIKQIAIIEQLHEVEQPCLNKKLSNQSAISPQTKQKLDIIHNHKQNLTKAKALSLYTQQKDQTNRIIAFKTSESSQQNPNHNLRESQQQNDHKEAPQLSSINDKNMISLLESQSQSLVVPVLAKYVEKDFKAKKQHCVNKAENKDKQQQILLEGNDIQSENQNPGQIQDKKQQIQNGKTKTKPLRQPYKMLKKYHNLPNLPKTKRISKQQKNPQCLQQQSLQHYNLRNKPSLNFNQNSSDQQSSVALENSSASVLSSMNNKTQSQHSQTSKSIDSHKTRFYPSKHHCNNSDCKQKYQCNCGAEPFLKWKDVVKHFIRQHQINVTKDMLNGRNNNQQNRIHDIKKFLKPIDKSQIQASQNVTLQHGTKYRQKNISDFFNRGKKDKKTQIQMEKGSQQKQIASQNQSYQLSHEQQLQLKSQP